MDGKDTNDAFSMRIVMQTEGAVVEEQMNPCLKYDVNHAKQGYRISSINSLRVIMAVHFLSTRVLQTC